MLPALLAVSTLSLLGVALVYLLLSSKIAAIRFPSELVAAVSRLTQQADQREQGLRDQIRFLQQSVVGLANERLRAQIARPVPEKDEKPEPRVIPGPNRWQMAAGIRTDTYSAGNE